LADKYSLRGRDETYSELFEVVGFLLPHHLTRQNAHHHQNADYRDHFGFCGRLFSATRRMSLHSHEFSRFWLAKGMWISRARLNRAFRAGHDFQMKRASTVDHRFAFDPIVAWR